MGLLKEVIEAELEMSLDPECPLNQQGIDSLRCEQVECVLHQYEIVLPFGWEKMTLVQLSHAMGM